MTRVGTGPARCTKCGAVWRVVHATLSEEGCIRCGGYLQPIAEAPRRFSPVVRRLSPAAGRGSAHERFQPNRW